VCVPYNEHLRVHEQNAGFTMLPEWDFEANKDKYPLLLHVPYFELYRRQVVKQADLELAMCMYGSVFSAEDKARNVDYYEQRTVRDSSLSANVQAVICAEVGHLELAYDYASEAAFIDLHDIHHNTRDGLHMASLAGAWVALVVGFGGTRDEGGQLQFTPRLPDAIRRLCFNLRWRGLKVKVDCTSTEATYSLRDGVDGSLTFYHEGDEVTLHAGASISRPITRITPLLARPKQPPGREPVSRGAAAGA
jgi:trehalose/maltose hydrolase-like predicted phosphorylase